MTRIINSPVHSKSAEEFLDAISPLGKHFNSSELGDKWLFRGQGREEPLRPSLFRNNGKLSSLTQRDVSDYPQFLLAERDILIEFFNIADKRGLILPDDSQQLRNTLETLSGSRGDSFISNGNEGWTVADMALSLVALAQHYGLPTRLLDWTLRPYTAAFFAAESAMKYGSKHDSNNPLVVWAFYFPLFGKHDELNRLTDPIRIVTAPSATNPNLKAQQGVFTLLNPLYTREDEAKDKYPALDKFLEGKAATADPDHSDSDKLIVACRLQKFTLPISEAGELLHLLAKLDITPSAIYPGFRSILKDLEMRNSFRNMLI